MSNHSPILSPPPELVASLRNSAPHGIRDAGVTRELWLINHAYAAGADQELEACFEWLAYEGHEHEHLALRAARRPKPPSLKEQALEALDDAVIRGDCITTSSAVDTIRRAIEQLPD